MGVGFERDGKTKPLQIQLSIDSFERESFGNQRTDRQKTLSLVPAESNKL